MLKIDHLTKTYGEKKAIDDLSLHIQARGIFGLKLPDEIIIKPDEK